MKFFTTTRLSENMEETPEGYLLCLNVSVARTGEMIYGVGEVPIQPDKDGKVVIVREAEEVFRPETIASFEGKSFTLQHPDSFVDPRNWRTLTRGIVQNVRRGSGVQEGDLVADLLVTDAEAISAIRNGMREVSCGYEAEYVETGVGRGLQKNIIGNHIALVEEGRAGASYAINDHKGKGLKMSLADRIKAIFGKAQDDALALVKTSDAEPEKKEEKKEEKKSEDSSSYDSLCKMVKDLGAMVEKMKPAADVQTQPTQSEPAMAQKDAEVAPSLEDRLKKLEQAVEKLLGMEAAEQAGDAEMEGEEEEEVVEDGDDMVVDADEEKEEKEEVGDSATVPQLTADEISRIEILAPGTKVSDLKTAKADALKACFATKDGKSVILKLTAGQEVDYANEGQVATIFVSASELLKLERSQALANTRTFDFANSSLKPKGSMTPEELNAKYEKLYAKK